MRTRPSQALGALCLWLILPCLCAAQVITPLPPVGPRPAVPGTAPPGPVTPSGVQEAKPDVVYLRDKNGTLQPVLGFTLEEFEKLLTAGKGLGPVLPRQGYRLETLGVTGTAHARHAELSIKLSIVVDEPDWVRVPLRLGGVYLRDKAAYQGPGEFRIEFDNATQEYTASLHGKSSEPHVITLPVIVPLDSLAGETRLKLSMPRAINSELSLDVPAAKATAVASTGLPVDAKPEPANRTRLHTVGLNGDFNLAWRAGGAPNAQTPTVLEVAGKLLARVEGHRVNTQAHLTVRGFGSEFEAFRVRLPEGATLLPSEHTDYTVELVDDESEKKQAKAEDAKPDTPSGKLAEVRLRNRTAGPIEVLLETEQTTGMVEGHDDLPLMFNGFEVLGHSRQWGYLAVQVVGDWQVLWGERSLIRQVEDLPMELRQPDVVAGFEYFSQPFSLVARVVRRQTRVSVEPEYVFDVGAKRIELEARLKYRIGVTQTFAVDVDLQGWHVDSVGAADGTAGLVHTDDVRLAEVEPLRIPFTRPTSGDVELLVRAHRDLADGAKNLRFKLPRPLAQAVSPARVAIVPANNVDLLVHEGEPVGMIRQLGRTPMKLPTREQPPLLYRAERPDASFAADMRVYNREMSVGVSTQVTISPDLGRVRQKLAYNIAHEAVSGFTLEVPTQVAESSELDIQLDGQSLNWNQVSDIDADTSRPVRLHVTLPSERIGLCDLEVSYPLPNVTLVPQATVPWQVPLVMPDEGTLTLNQLSIVMEPGIRVQVRDSYWKVPETPATGPAAGPSLRLLSDVRRNEVVLNANLDERPTADATEVDRAWIQSWFSARVRQDRAVYRLVTHDREFKVKLPPGARATEVAVDGVRIPGLTPSELVIPLGDAMTGKPVTVELRYHFPDRKAHEQIGSMAIPAPTLDPNVAVRRLYWQLVLPSDEHLLAGDQRFSEEWDWGWRGITWGRLPLRSQFELETWSGAAHDPALPGSVNEYLFSTTEPNFMLGAQTIQRSTLVLMASGTVLLAGLLFIYVPLVRHPAVVLILVVGLVAAGGTFPEPALLVAEAAAFGLLLSLLALWLRRGVSRRQTRLTMIGGSPSSVVERSSMHTQSEYRAPWTGSMAPTTAMPTAQLSAPDSNS